MSRHESQPAKKVAAAFAALLLLGPLPARAQGWADAPAAKELYAKAKAEGEVVFWGTQAREVDWIPQAFAKVFPGIAVKVVGDNNITTTAIAEARAGRNQLDVFWHSLTGVAALLDRDLVAANDWKMFGVSPENTEAQGKLGFTNNIVYAFMYNEKKADKALLPKTWNDVLKPELKDKMVASEFLMPRLSGALVFSMGHDEAMNFARGLRDKAGLLMTRAPREPIVQSGERTYSVAELDQQVRLWKSEGLDVGYVIPEPVTASQFVAAVMTKAPHPNAARLLAGWLASDQGKAAREQAIFTADYRPGSKSAIAKPLLDSGVKIHFDDIKQVEQRNKYFKEAADILSGQMR